MTALLSIPAVLVAMLVGTWSSVLGIVAMFSFVWVPQFIAARIMMERNG